MALERCNSEHMRNLPDMVCLNNEEKIECTVYDKTPYTKQKRHGFSFRSSYKIENLFTDIATAFSYDDFELKLQLPNKDKLVNLSDKKHLTLDDISGDRKRKYILHLMPKGSTMENNLLNKDSFTELRLPPATSPAPYECTSSDDDLALGASASPTETGPTEFDPYLNSIAPPTPPALPMFLHNESASTMDNKFTCKLKLASPPTRPNSGYVGLVNQAMTCYLNSLLQALFMTPEFRNALYKMKFIEKDKSKDKSIPFQLQKLFVNLQTSSKMAVETTDLTKSFGWDSTQAWTQHDVQELCRVMFDALEKEFQRTEQENWINKYYEGKMMDYVKCLECGIENCRDDKFLDIPLPVRPFGSNRAYESVEEALRAFVQPETLDGNNQYFCEKCNKKCDAHKGLKFMDFPYILTLHLKRFDFDYQTLHRIKLNDKVTFPQTLNLNCFVNATDIETFANLKNNNHSQLNGYITSVSSENENSETVAKFDDCSTTDSGAALEEDNCSGFGTTASSSHHESELQEDDEGIELITESRCQLSHGSGPYIYELFSIMVHSGSASGGHYYAYIKDFENGEWYCFNDQTVSPITQDDIQKSFGGDSLKQYYSGIYSSSTNAYMLMYRRIDPEQNEKAITIEEFPEHIVNLRQYINDSEQEEKKRRDDTEILKPRIYFYNPKLKQMKDARAYVTRNSSLKSTLEIAHGMLNVQQFAPISRCRLVAYDHYTEQIESSLDGMENNDIQNILELQSTTDLLLEIREKNEKFESYGPGGLTLKTFKVDLNTFDIDGPHLLWIQEKEINQNNLKKLIAKKNDIECDSVHVAIIYSKSEMERRRPSQILYACENNPKENASELLNKLAKEDCPHITYIYLTVPPTDEKSLENLCIPPYKALNEQQHESDYVTPKQSPLENNTVSNVGSSSISGADEADVVDAVLVNSNKKKEKIQRAEETCSSWLEAESNQRKSSPLPMITVLGGTGITGGGHESEDSSLSDGDRTLVESTRNDLSNGSSPSHSPQLSSPEEDNNLEKLRNCMNKEESNFYFRATEIEKEHDSSTHHHYHSSSGSSNHPLRNGLTSDSSSKHSKFDANRLFKIFVDNRMSIERFRECLQSIIGVPAEHFKVPSNTVYNRCNFKEGEQVTIELERYLKPDEIKAKIYYLKLSQLTDFSGKLLSICQYVLQTNKHLIDLKTELIAYLHKLNSDYKTLTIENCRIWRMWGRNPESILNDDSCLADLRISRSRYNHNCELVVQECENQANMNTNDDTTTLFARRFYPSTLKLGTFEEITFDKKFNIKQALASISGIEENNLVFFISSSTFPHTDLSVLDVRNYDWYEDPNSKIALSNCENGKLCVYKNKEENLMSLSEKELLEIRRQERKRIDANNGSSTSFLLSPRKEHALKIYLDSSPKTSDD